VSAFVFIASVPLMWLLKRPDALAGATGTAPPAPAVD